jgi:hypothetical protein
MILEEERQRNLIEEKMNKINLEEIKVLDRMKYTRNDTNTRIESERSYQSPNKNYLKLNNNGMKLTARGSGFSSGTKKK